MNRKMILAACAAMALSIQAQTATDSLKTSTVSHMIGVGPSKVLDTYLSAEHFSGSGLSFLNTIERQKPGSPWSLVMQHEVNISSVHDRTDRRDELEGAYNFYIGRLHEWNLADGRLRLQAGGMTNACLGFIYNSSNSNNPAQARAHVNLMPTGAMTYRFHLFGQPLTARYELALPLAGVMFSPNYGQSYYETFAQGNYDGNVRMTTFITAPEFRQLFTIDAPISRKIALRIGYLGNYQQYKVNNLKQHVYTHRLMIGVTRRFSILPRKL